MLELKLDIEEIDYADLIALMLPLVNWDTVNIPSVLRMALKSTDPQGASEAVRKVLKLMPKDKQDALVMSIVNSNKDRLISKIHRVSAAKGVKMSVYDLSFTKKNDTVILNEKEK